MVQTLHGSQRLGAIPINQRFNRRSQPAIVGQQLGGRLARTGQKVVLVPIAKRLKADVPFPAVGVDRAVGLDSLLDEAVQSVDFGRIPRIVASYGSFVSPRRLLLRRRSLPDDFFLRLPSAQSLFNVHHIGLD